MKKDRLSDDDLLEQEEQESICEGEDEHLNNYISLCQPFYYAGQSLDVVVHIACTKDRFYRKLMIQIQGKEEVKWSEASWKGKVISDKRQTYLMNCELAYFKDGIKKGHYSYPFSILLPSSMPASFSQSLSNSITYKISAVIPQYDNQSSDQLYSRQFHVRQPPRGVMNNFRGLARSEQFKYFCFSNGTCNLFLEADASFLKLGQRFHVKGHIDASMSKIVIKNYKLLLRERTTKCARSQHGEKVSLMDKDFLLHDFKKSIQKGQKENFEVEVTISQKVAEYTSIGNIISRAYFLTLVGEVDSSYSQPSIELHAVVNNILNPFLNLDEIRLFPQGWNPQIAPSVTLTDIPFYLYNHMEGIKTHNQMGSAVNISQEMHEMPSQRLLVP